jgi:2-polyprenyl-3-methyl-5-hydroxy-6-metoxy-1,4-benzoquinol methylase
MPDFSRRSNDIEIMDDLSCSGEVVHQTLRELETINELLGGNYVTINGISQLIENTPRRRVTVADLGCGSGDILKLIRKWSIKRKVDLVLTGIDANPNITAYAAAHTPASLNISYEPVDIFSEEFRKRKFDIVLGTLFFHHFTTHELIGFFKQIKDQVSTGIVVNDIHRHWFAYYSIKWLTGFFSRSAMVKFDAPLSVLRSFRKKELEEIMDQAGITDYTIRWMWAFRWQIVIRLGRR